jgi:hypothetical protein
VKSTSGAATSARRRPPDQHLRERRAGGERSFGGALDHRPIGQRIRERHAQLDDVGAAAVHRADDLG